MLSWFCSKEQTDNCVKLILQTVGNDGFSFSSYHLHSPKTCVSVRTCWSPESCHPNSVNYSFNNFACSLMLLKGLHLEGSAVACSVSSQAHVLAMNPPKEVICSWGFFVFCGLAGHRPSLEGKGHLRPSPTFSFKSILDVFMVTGIGSWKCMVVALLDLSKCLIHLFWTQLTMCVCKSWSVESSLL